MELRYEISDRPDASLVRAVLAGEPESFIVLVGRREGKIYSYLVHLTGCREEAFDLCQEVFISSYRNLPQLKDPEKFRCWLFRIAHNKANAHSRAARPSKLISRDMIQPRPLLCSECATKGVGNMVS